MTKAWAGLGEESHHNKVVADEDLELRPSLFVSITRRRSSWKKLLLYREGLHVHKVVLSLPRFPFLGIIWTVLELCIFFLTLFQTDYSFETLDMTAQMLKARTEQQGLLGESRETSGVEQQSLLTLTVGGLHPNASVNPETYCGALPGTPFFFNSNLQPLLSTMGPMGDGAADVGLLWWPQNQDERQRAERKFGKKESRQMSLNRDIARTLLCKRTDPMWDQRFIVAGWSQQCKGPQVFPEGVKALEICSKPEDYVFRLEVCGIRAICFFTYPIEDPLAGWSVPCIRFSEEDLETVELQWIIGPLSAAWNKIKVSALAWIILSIIMRIQYWRTLVIVTRRTLAHLRTECPKRSLHNTGNLVVVGPPLPSAVDKVRAEGEKEEGLNGQSGREDKRLPNHGNRITTAMAGPRWSHENNHKDEGSRTTDKTRFTPPSATTGTVPHDGGGGGAGASGRRQQMQSWLTATSIGIACANNDSLYLGLAVIRQYFGAIYAELLTSSALSTVSAGWQAFGIVVYHEAIIMLVFRVLWGVLGSKEGGERRRRRRAMATIADIGVLGYVSLLALSMGTHTIQQFNWDLLFLFQSSNKIIAAFWWFLFTGCTPQGFCVYVRGDIITHTICAIYIALLALGLQTAINLWRKRKREGQRTAAILALLTAAAKKEPAHGPQSIPSSAPVPTPAASPGPSSALALGQGKATAAAGGAKGGLDMVMAKQGGSSPVPSHLLSEVTEEWAFLGTVGCPHCHAIIVEQITLIPSSPKRSPTRVAEAPEAPSDGRTKKSERCCLWHQCPHLCLDAESEEEEHQEQERPFKISHYRFMSC